MFRGQCLLRDSKIRKVIGVFASAFDHNSVCRNSEADLLQVATISNSARYGWIYADIP